MAADPSDAPLLETPLAEAHRALGARMVPFAGYAMPVQYPSGILGEHNWTRTSAGLFDVSHMGQAMLAAADGRHETVARALEMLVPADILGLKPGAQRYTQFTADDGGILDDLMVSRPDGFAPEGSLFLVVNAGCKDADYAHLQKHLPSGVTLKILADRALIALQGPLAADVLRAFIPEAADMTFMTARAARFDGKIPVALSRSGYTGEDGYEISIPAADAPTVWKALLGDSRVKPIGLGARDSLRLEAGMCLYGHDIDTTTSPVEAQIQWSIQKRRREEGGFPGAARIQKELRDGPARKRVGILPDGRAPAREGTEIRSNGQTIGAITSGGFGPTKNAPVAMGYVQSAFSAPGTKIELMVRGNALPATIAPMPFVPNGYKR